MLAVVRKLNASCDEKEGTLQARDVFQWVEPAASSQPHPR
jgi:hypothetical protein